MGFLTTAVKLTPTAVKINAIIVKRVHKQAKTSEEPVIKVICTYIRKAHDKKITGLALKNKLINTISGSTCDHAIMALLSCNVRERTF